MPPAERLNALSNATDLVISWASAARRGAAGGGEWSEVRRTAWQSIDRLAAPGAVAVPGADADALFAQLRADAWLATDLDLQDIPGPELTSLVSRLRQARASLRSWRTVAGAAQSLGDPAPAARPPHSKGGRPRDTDAGWDEQVAAAWASPEHRSYADLAGAFGVREADIRRALDRHRKRRRG